jgi:hypothetical protein
VGHADNRPEKGKQREARFHAQYVDDIAHHRLQHDAALEGAGDPAILLGGDVQAGDDGGGGDGQGLPRQEIHQRPQHDQADGEPA